MPKLLTEGRTFDPQLTTLPIQQEQQSDPFGILDGQYQEAVKNTDMEFGQVQEEMLRKTRYELQKLSEKYQQERSYIEGLQVPADQKRQKLLQLNNKYELAAITARSKVKPDTDALNMQKQQMVTQLQQEYQQKQRDLRLVQQLVDEGIIKDPDEALQKQYAMVGINFSVGAYREPTYEELVKEQMLVDYKVGELETALETATGREREGILLGIADLKQQRARLMGVQAPEYAENFEKANRLSNFGLQMQAGRKPGTLAEGIWQQKQKKTRTVINQWRGFSPGTTWQIPEKKQKTGKGKTPTGKIKVISPSGQTGTISAENWKEAEAAGYRRVD